MPSSYEEKQSGEPSRISWGSAQCHLATSKTLFAKPTQKRTDTRVKITNLTVVREMLITRSHWSLGISQRNSTSFTKLFFAGRCTRAGHKTNTCSWFLVPQERNLPHNRCLFSLSATRIMASMEYTIKSDMPGRVISRILNLGGKLH